MDTPMDAVMAQDKRKNVQHEISPCDDPGRGDIEGDAFEELDGAGLREVVLEEEEGLRRLFSGSSVLDPGVWGKR